MKWRGSFRVPSGYPQWNLVPLISKFLYSKSVFEFRGNFFLCFRLIFCYTEISEYKISQNICNRTLRYILKPDSLKHYKTRTLLLFLECTTQYVRLCLWNSYETGKWRLREGVKKVVFWDVMSCILVDGYRNFAGKILPEYWHHIPECRRFV